MSHCTHRVSRQLNRTRAARKSGNKIIGRGEKKERKKERKEGRKKDKKDYPENKLLQVLLRGVLIAALVLALVLALDGDDFERLDSAGLDSGLTDELVEVTGILTESL